ncbi:hypothetical protein STAFG_4391 [Streptomyces afghaniensis 772]|uniref:Glycosyltransferase 2-like domain-containing protein n=1 Tax=Streptomyces afghaniensis 772 TaxID=1283301 RepID=S4MSI4_9ACTN|nr:glycosyltransferase family 2 protein [Streptomyces afghaniensis]EPJ38525.1 hypothetical protein STAFG_4391 [Streptomyces afghaniensis 772]
MSGPKFSIVIPYKQRLDNIRLCFESLAEQSLEKGEFEVLVGVMEYSPEYVALCQEFTDRLTVVSVLSGDEWQITRARNMAMRQASGQVMVQLDADMALPPRFLENLYRKHFAYGQNVCVIGQMIGYDNNNSDVDDVDVRPFGHYREKLAELDAADEVRMDMRLQVDHVVPWAFAWTALIALPTALVVENDLISTRTSVGTAWRISSGRTASAPPAHRSSWAGTSTASICRTSAVSRVTGRRNASTTGGSSGSGPGRMRNSPLLSATSRRTAWRSTSGASCPPSPATAGASL